MPRVDGYFLTEPPQYAVLRGHVANVPIITGTLLLCVLCGVSRFMYLNRKLRRRGFVVLDVIPEHHVCFSSMNNHSAANESH